jgi:hypothetical protein
LTELGARDMRINSAVHRFLFLNASINALIDALIVNTSLASGTL